MSLTALRLRGGAPRAILAALLRFFSLVLALTTSALIFALPQTLAHTAHGLLALVMLGVCAGFVHGVGFVPQHKAWRIAFSPWLSWPLMGVGLWLLAAA